jgi:hypothetical protein
LTALGSLWSDPGPRSTQRSWGDLRAGNERSEAQGAKRPEHASASERSVGRAKHDATEGWTRVGALAPSSKPPCILTLNTVRCPHSPRGSSGAPPCGEDGCARFGQGVCVVRWRGPPHFVYGVGSLGSMVCGHLKQHMEHEAITLRALCCRVSVHSTRWTVPAQTGVSRWDQHLTLGGGGYSLPAGLCGTSITWQRSL